MKKLILLLPIVLLLLLAIPSVVSAAPMIRIYEYESGVMNNYTDIYGGRWAAQLITIGEDIMATSSPESHTVFLIVVSVQRVGSGDPGALVVGIQEVDQWNRPTGEDIVSGTVDASFASNTTYGGFSIRMTSEEGFAYNTTYAIVFSCETGDASNCLRLYAQTPGTYTGGYEWVTNDAGSTWDALTNNDILFAIYGRPLLVVNKVNVFQDCYEDGDMLFVISYENYYKPFYPLEDTPSHFTLQLRDTDGTTLIAQTSLRAWGYKPAEIYLSADAAAPLNIGDPYMVVMSGSLVPENPSANYTLVSADWRGSSLARLETWVINLAKQLEVHYDVDLLEAVGNDELLNDQGAVFFLTGMPSLIDLIPNIFLSGATIIRDYEAGTGAFDAATTWDTEMGPTVANAVIDTADMIGVDEPSNVAGILLMIGYLALCCIVVGAGGDASIAAFLAVPVILGGTQLRILPFAFIATIAGVAILLLVYRFWWSRT